jgi:hypothetical protein
MLYIILPLPPNGETMLLIQSPPLEGVGGGFIKYQTLFLIKISKKFKQTLKHKFDFFISLQHISNNVLSKKYAIMKKIFISIVFLLSLSACEETPSILGNLGISDLDNIAGLKEALSLGATNAAGTLGKENGYLLDNVVKINLPEEAQTALSAIKTIQNLRATIEPYASLPIVGQQVTQLLNNIPDLSNDFDNILVTAINRAAEHAAPGAVNVFADAIKRMSINDAKSILFTDNDFAATEYLKANTFSGLQGEFGPIINESLETVKVGDYTANSAWNLFAEQNNKLANFLNNNASIINTAASFVPELGNIVNNINVVDTNLGSYVTGKALDGLFTKVGNEELKIRTDVNARTTDLLQKVFGQLDNK